MAKRKKKLTVALLCEEAAKFAEIESTYPEPTLYGVTDGKAVGTISSTSCGHISRPSTSSLRAILRRASTSQS